MTVIKRIAVVLCLSGGLGLAGSAGVAFAAKNELSWTRTTQVTVRVQTGVVPPARPSSSRASGRTAEPSRSPSPGVARATPSAAVSVSAPADEASSTNLTVPSVDPSPSGSSGE